MTCNEARQHWMLYLDSEGDAELHFRISDHVGMCPACAEWFSKQERLERLLAERLRCSTASGELWGRILHRTGVAPAPRARRWRRTAWSLVGAVALLGLAAVGMLLFLTRPALGPDRSEPDLTRLTADCHERHLRGLSQVEFRSQDGQAVARYLHQHVSFPVNRPPHEWVEFAVEGCGVCRWAPKPMAYIAGRYQQTSVSIFVLARDSLNTFPHTRDCLTEAGGLYRCQERGYETVSTITPENVVVVVGTARPQALEQVLNAYVRADGE
jgi:anti-sigma factor RsiW